MGLRQTGADNLVTSVCPSKFSKCWNEAVDAYTLATVDLHVFIYREHLAYSRFLDAWADQTDSSKTVDPTEVGTAADLRADAKEHVNFANGILATMEKYLWSERAGHYVGRNMSTGESIPARVYLMGMPLWGSLAPIKHHPQIVKNLLQDDMDSPFGIRSTSSKDPRYTNANMITPYSNWRGPIWINANAMLIYGLAKSPNHSAIALTLAGKVVHVLAEDLRSNGTWHECLSSADGHGLAAPGFLSWDTLGATLLEDARALRDPFQI